MTLVSDLQVGEKIKFNNIEVYVREVLSTKVLVSKDLNGAYFFSVPFFSHKYDDLANRVELAF